MPTRLGCWVYSACLEFIAPLLLLTDPLQSHASWAQVSCPLDTTCPQLPSPARCWPLNLRAATSAVSLSHAYSSCRMRLNNWASLRKAFLAHLWLWWTRCVCVLPHTHHTCPCLSHNTQHFRHFLFPSTEVSPVWGCEHLDDQDCGRLIPTVHCFHRPLSINSPHAPNCIRPSLKLQKSLEPRGY